MKRVDDDAPVRRSARRSATLAACAALGLLACGGEDGPGVAADAPARDGGGLDGGGADGGSLACGSVTPLFGVGEVLARPGDACHPWVRGVYGRVASSGAMSAVVWSLATPSSTGLLVSAVHTLGEGYFVDPGSAVEASLTSPADQAGVARIFLLAEGVTTPAALATPMFLVFHPAIPADESGDRMTRIRPEHDFYLAAVDSQLVQTEPIAGVPGPLVHEPPTLFDPDGLARTPPTHADAVAGEDVLLLGFPQQGELAGQLAASVGRVLTTTEAEAAIEALRLAGDEEGDIPYRPEAEALVEGEAQAGMSGGAAFDRAGRLVGVLVRASSAEIGARYVRVVRLSFVRAQVGMAYEGLAPAARAAVLPYLEPPVP